MRPSVTPYTISFCPLLRSFTLINVSAPRGVEGGRLKMSPTTVSTLSGLRLYFQGAAQTKLLARVDFNLHMPANERLSWYYVDVECSCFPKEMRDKFKGLETK